jgi:hypothetical protein
LERDSTLQRSPRKVFEEAKLTMMLMVDISGSESFGSKANLKRYCYRDCRHHGFSATQNNDKIGLILFSDQIEHSAKERQVTCLAYHP